jgi:predicted nucleotidyltransferase
MTSAASFDISTEQFSIVRDILRRHLPAGALVWAFGSRVTGRTKPFSDLDLLVDAGHALTLDQSAELAEAFDESDLPFKVDIVDQHRAGASFRAAIAKDGLLAIDFAA